ncbi:MAG TPA: acyl-CoA dehydrogenase family protein [Planctomycetota bacterium]|nr:acyl-CoA dehydrogenase family protein [Planctomycetota bacterium]
MDLSYNADHESFREAARDFAARVVAPGLRERDEKAEPDLNIYRKMGEEGFLGVSIPKKYGGLGLDYHTTAILSEEFEYIDSAARVIISVHNGLHSMALLQWATEAQKQKYLAPLARGEKIATFCLTEPAAGTDVAGIQAFAEKKGDRYVLTGEKIWISLSTIADQYLVMAYTDRAKQQQRDHSGITAFIVERQWKGVSPYALHGKLGVRSGVTGGVAFQDVEIPAENMIGNVDEGFRVAMSALDNGRYTVAAGAIGLIRACLDASVKYCHERQTFKREIGKHQLVQQMIANMAQSRDIGDLLVRKCGWMKNAGKRCTREVALAKWTNTVNAQLAADHAIEIHGAYGYSNEFPVERFWRNSRGAVIYEGSKEVQQIIQAEYALGYRHDGALRCELPPYVPEA